MTHKEFQQVVNDDFYQVLLVGAAKNNAGYEVRDNTGDNISLKNQNFCELTGLYWLWKNANDDVIGLCHYRRYFVENSFCNKRNILNKENTNKCLEVNDMIMPRKRWFDGKNALDFYSIHHNIEDWNRMKSVVKRLYPDYMEDICWFEKQKMGYCYNMFVSTKNMFDSYCEWLFSILFELEKITNISEYSNYNKRLYGFLSERLINIWIHHNKLRVCEKKVYNPKMFSMIMSQTKEYVVRKLKNEDK